MINNDDIYRELAKKHKLTIDEVRDVVTTPFEFVAMSMRNADAINMDYDNILLNGFGKFVVKSYRKVVMKKIAIKRRDKKDGII